MANNRQQARENKGNKWYFILFTGIFQDQGAWLSDVEGAAD